MNKKLYRDEYHKVIGGVCSGLAEYFEIDVTVVRLLFAFSFFIMGVGFVPYIILWIVLPRKAYPFNAFNSQIVDYTVPPQQQYSTQFNTPPPPPPGNPFGGNPFGGNPFGGNPMGNVPPKQKSNAGIIIGVVLIVLGAAFLIDNFDLFPNFDIWNLWPAMLVIIGGALIVSGQKKQPWHDEKWQDTDKKETPSPEDTSTEETTPTPEV